MELNTTIPYIKCWIKMKLLTREDIATICELFRNALRRCLFLDYDGTLVPFQIVPLQAAPNETLLELLSKLSNDTRNCIAIVSGRDGDTLDKWFNTMPIILIAEHGAQIKHVHREWRHEISNAMAWKMDINHIMKEWSMRWPQTFVEQKKFSLAWHYRALENSEGVVCSRQLISRIDEVVRARMYAVDIIDGSKVIEVRLRGINKGVAVLNVLKESAQQDFIMAVGDDTTDEDMFGALRGLATTIKVGGENSQASYCVHAYNDVLELLSLFSKTV
jgi:trehalose 6-phosphate synthase/phosphatase